MCDLQERRHPIYRYECLRDGERKGRGVNDYKLLETRLNGSTWGSLLESTSKMSTWVSFYKLGYCGLWHKPNLLSTPFYSLFF